MARIQKSLQENTHGRKLERAGTSFPHPQRAPWLVAFSQGKHRKVHTIVSISEERVYVREVEEISRSYYCGGCRGWVFMMDLAHRSCFLFNLLSKKKIMLPPPPRGSDCISEAIITSAPPPLAKQGSSCSILAYRDAKDFLFHNLNNNNYFKWEVVKCKWEGDGAIRSLVKCGGTIYALAGLSCDLVVVDFVPHPKVRPLHVKSPPPPSHVPFCPHILDSCGDLFLVLSFLVYGGPPLRIHSFAVYKLDDEKMKWVQVHGIGDRAFFLGVSGSAAWAPSMSCSASRAGVTANCIYFVDDDVSSIFKFDMADQSVSTELSWPSLPWDEIAWIDVLKS